MGVPTIFQMMADHPDFDGADLRCVRDALCGGAGVLYSSSPTVAEGSWKQ